MYGKNGCSVRPLRRHLRNGAENGESMRFLSDWKAKGKKFTEQKCYAIFCYAVLITAGIYLLGSLLTKGWLADKIFFIHTGDFFMDFFNSIRDASLGLGSYTERHVIYPPMANLIFVLFSKITPDAYNATSFDDRMTWNSYGVNVALCVVFTVVCTLLFLLVSYCILDGSRKKKMIFAAVSVFSVPFLYMMERGNIMVLAVIALLCYVFTYDSEKAWVRELGLLALAFSFSLKLYPIMFAWVLLADKRYKEFFRCAIYSVALLILPTFAFGGPSCLLIIFENIFGFSSGVSAKGALAVISEYSGIPQALVSGTAYGLFLLCGACFAVSAFLYREKRERWKIWILGCITFAAFPPLSSIYAWILFLIPLALIFHQGFALGDIKGYFIPVIIPFLFIPIPLPHQLPANTVVMYVCLVFLEVYAICDTVRNLVQLRKKSAA